LFAGVRKDGLYLQSVKTIILSDLVTKKTVFFAPNPPSIFKNAWISGFEKYKMLYLFERNNL
jgi:hypothetical protein